MTDKVEHLMLEQLRRLDAKADTILEAVQYIYKQQLADRHVIRGMQLSLDGTNDLLVSLSARVGRIERRLELSEDPVPAGLSESRRARYDAGPKE